MGLYPKIYKIKNEFYIVPFRTIWLVPFTDDVITRFTLPAKFASVIFISLPTVTFVSADMISEELIDGLSTCKPFTLFAPFRSTSITVTVVLFVLTAVNNGAVPFFADPGVPLFRLVTQPLNINTIDIIIIQDNTKNFDFIIDPPLNIT